MYKPFHLTWSLVLFQIYVTSQLMLGILVLFFIEVIELCQRAAYVTGMQKFPVQLSLTAVVSRAILLEVSSAFSSRTRCFSGISTFSHIYFFSSVQALYCGFFSPLWS